MEDKKKNTKIPSGKKKVKDIKQKDNKKEIDKKQDIEIAKLNEKIIRLSAELQNIRKRNEAEIAKIAKYDGEKMIISLLPIIDNFERAINVDEKKLSDELSKYLSGFKMIYTSLLNILENNGVKLIDALNKPFDPNCMEAILTEKVKDKDSNIVLEVMQKGYIYKDKVIRPAMVKVSE